MILALDGALGGFSCALLRDGELTSRSLPAQSSLEGGLEAVDELLAERGAGLGVLEGIAVGIGPGSFTGIRIVVAFAKSLAFGAALPICGVSSYDALESREVELPALTVVSGRAGVVCARLRLPAEETRRCGNTADVVEEIASRCAGTISVTGAAEDVLAALGERGMSVRECPPRDQVAARAIALIARERGFENNVHAVAPEYGELPAVTVQKKKEQRRR